MQLKTILESIDHQLCHYFPLKPIVQYHEAFHRAVRPAGFRHGAHYIQVAYKSASFRSIVRPRTDSSGRRPPIRRDPSPFSPPLRSERRARLSLSKAAPVLPGQGVQSVSGTFIVPIPEMPTSGPTVAI